MCIRLQAVAHDIETNKASYINKFDFNLLYVTDFVWES